MYIFVFLLGGGRPLHSPQPRVAELVPNRTSMGEKLRNIINRRWWLILQIVPAKLLPKTVAGDGF